MERHIIALVGAYGSGKTELSLNLAARLSKNCRTVLADLDIVNPYFRSSEKVAEMEKLGVEVITPVFANTNVDSPMLSPKVGGYFVYKDINYILDAGGDQVGSKALGQYRHKIAENGGKLFFVVNTKRPFTKDVDSIIDMMAQVERGSSMKIDGIIHNSNMSFESTGEELIEGHKIISEVARQCNLPIVLTCGMKENLERFVKETGYTGETMVIDRFMELTI